MVVKLPDMILIQRGHFIMGSIPELDTLAFESEFPAHVVYLTDFHISRMLVTNAEYAVFLEATNYQAPEGWRGKHPPLGKEEHPVVNVSWHDAQTYCRWLSQATGKPFRLPSEAEWEKAARGLYANLYPWGYKWEAGRCNTQEAGNNSTSPVGHFKGDVSPYRVLDLAGNVFEWTGTLWSNADRGLSPFRYPYSPDDGREELAKSGKISCVVRGGSFLRPHRYARCASRMHYVSTQRMIDIGFRLAIDWE
jgi:formylglycine-generating enzyme required for sulfatase activity